MSTVRCDSCELNAGMFPQDQGRVLCLHDTRGFMVLHVNICRCRLFFTLSIVLALFIYSVMYPSVMHRDEAEDQNAEARPSKGRRRARVSGKDCYTVAALHSEPR
jgi:hypothetical protein